MRSGSDPCFVSAEWLSNNPAVVPGGTIKDLSCYNGMSAQGGYAIVGYNYDNRYSHLYLTGLGIQLAARTANGTSAHSGVTGNHHLIDIDVRNSLDGAIYVPDKVTDTGMTECAINNCGRTNGFAVEAWTLSGWHVYQNKVYSCPGGLIRDVGGTQNVILDGNNFE